MLQKAVIQEGMDERVVGGIKDLTENCCWMVQCCISTQLCFPCI